MMWRKGILMRLLPAFKVPKINGVKSYKR